MQISVHLENPQPDASASGPAVVGWFLNLDKGGVMYDAPQRARTRAVNRSHPKSAARCPAAINAESRYFEIKCPFDLHLQFTRDSAGQANLRSLDGDASGIRAAKLKEVVHLVKENEWRFPDRPTLQLILPYVFVSDEAVYVSQLPPFLHYRPDPWPGTQFCGRFPINVWPRPLLWAFEWHDIEKPLILRRGEPLFYVAFETLPQDRPVQLVEAEKTKELLAYYDMISGVTNYVNQTFSLFQAAEERRPAKLLTPKS